MSNPEKLICVQPYYNIREDQDVFRLSLPRATHPMDFVFSSKTPPEFLKEGLLEFLDAIFKIKS